MRDDESGWWDISQVCLNGHLITQRVIEERDHCAAFCTRCGEPTLVACCSCCAPIPGEYHAPTVSVLDAIDLPAFCLACGSPYPWTVQRVESAKELADELVQLKPRERVLLKQSIDDLLTESPRTELAIVRFKRLIAHSGEDTRIAFREMLVLVVSEAVRRALWGG